MQPDAPQALLETLAESLELMAFIMLDPVTEPPAAPEEAVVVSMGFSGPVSGSVQVIAPRAFATMLSANVLGSDPSDEDALVKADDCLKELVNVVGGALMPKLSTSPDDVFKLELPTLRTMDDSEWTSISATSQLAMADGHVIAARLV